MIRWGFFYVFCTLLAAVVVLSLLLIPANASDPLRAVPFSARVVFQGGDLARFNEVFPSFAKASEGRPNLGSLDGEFSKHWKKTFQGLESRPLTVASFSSGNREGWLLVTELSGWDVLKLRWRKLLFLPETVSRTRPYAVWPVWKLGEDGRNRIRFSLVEGLLICSISPDSRDIYKVLDALDGRVGSQAIRWGK